tara:strand:+ start:1334 stop:1777 length:444 start_codon:yes stop_codon:yes gene_type:complete
MTHNYMELREKCKRIGAKISATHNHYKGETPMTGNVISDIQWSTFIRPATARMDGRDSLKDGDLMRFDLNSMPNYAGAIKDVARRYAEHGDASTIVYIVRHYYGDGARAVIVGACITDTEHKLLWRSYPPRDQHEEILTQFIERVTL